MWHKRAELWTAERRVHFERQCDGLRVVLLKEGERQTHREREKEKRRPPIKTDQRVFSHSLSLWRTLTFSSPLLYNVGRFCVDPENKQHSGGEGDLFALTVLASTVVIRTSASKRKRNREERIEEKICSSHVHSSLFLQYIHIHIGTPSREYMSNTRSKRERVHMNNERIWTIKERIRTDEKWLLTILFCCSLSVGHYRWSCWKEEKYIHTHLQGGKTYIYVWKKWVWRKTSSDFSSFNTFDNDRTNQAQFIRSSW